MSTTLTITGLSVRYGARTLVEGLDLVLATGGVTALVGPNGSGKSSLMRTLVGELPLEAGSVRLAPTDATIGWLPQDTPDPTESLLAYARRRTGVAEADLALHEASTSLAGGEADADDRYAAALEHWLALGGADLEDRLPQVAAQLGLEAHPDRPLGTLSGGQAARAALASVLLSRYDVLLLDEPTNNLDASGLALMVDFVTGHDGPCWSPATTATSSTASPRASSSSTWPSGASATTPADGPTSTGPASSSGGRHARPSRSTPRRATASSARAASAPTGPTRDVATSARRDEPDKNIREKFRARADRQDAKAARVRRAVDRLSRSSTSRARSGSCATRSTPARSRRRSCGRWTAWSSSAAASPSDRSTSRSSAGTGSCSRAERVRQDHAAGRDARRARAELRPRDARGHACGSA